MKRFVMSLIAASLFASNPAQAAPAKSLDELLKQVKTGLRGDRTANKKREAEFARDKSRQAALLSSLRAKVKAEENRSELYEKEFEQNELRIAEQQQLLATRLGTLGELFGVIRQVAGDTRANIAGSMASAQFRGRDSTLESLAESKELPRVEQLEALWFVLQQEMTESGKVTKFPAKVVEPSSGKERELQVTRVGVFTAVADGKYLEWLPEVQQLSELGRQPDGRYLSSIGKLESATSGYTRVAIDPSRGTILSLVVLTPSVRERLEFGGMIGYILIAVGIAAFILAILRLIYLVFVGMKVRGQLGAKEARKDNPLGRVMSVFQANPNVDTETLELKLDEAILRESAQLERFLWLIKVVAVAAPLMGLLGTVTGMIRTFQAITLFGTGDPRLMAGGISEALVTTMLGLLVAIPLVLLHSALSSMSRSLVDVVEEQSAGIVATRAEKAAPPPQSIPDAGAPA